jgi:hypothetical protein
VDIEAICSSETSVETERTTRRHIPEDDTLQKLAYVIHMQGSPELGAVPLIEEAERFHCLLGTFVTT